MRILILGAGAVGGYIGTKLIESGSDVVFVARGDRLKQLSQHGLVVRSLIGTIMASADGPHLTWQLFNECLSVARKEGRAPDAETMTAYLTLLTQSGSRFTSSMLRDIEGRRRTECNHILGDMLRRAKSYEFDTPILRVCVAHLACYEAGISQQTPSAAPPPYIT